MWINKFIFFFKQKTAYELRISDWSSDVCSSDLVHVSGAAIYDSNAAGASKARAAARGLVQEEMEFRPSINASLVLPFDDHVFFLDTQAGYEFHSRNKRLESERIAVDGSVRLDRKSTRLNSSH